MMLDSRMLDVLPHLLDGLVERLVRLVLLARKVRCGGVLRLMGCAPRLVGWGCGCGRVGAEGKDARVQVGVVHFDFGMLERCRV